MPDEERWQDRARCSGVDTELFYPSRDSGLYATQAEMAKTYCRGEHGTDLCPVIRECLLEALRFPDHHGIWGGMSSRERRALFRKRVLPPWITREDLDEIGEQDGYPIEHFEEVPGDETEGHLPPWPFGEVDDVTAYRLQSAHRRPASLRDYKCVLVYQGVLVSA